MKKRVFKLAGYFLIFLGFILTFFNSIITGAVVGSSENIHILAGILFIAGLSIVFVSRGPTDGRSDNEGSENKYKNFQNEFELYAQLNNYTSQAAQEGKIDYTGKKILASMATDEALKQSILRTKDPEHFAALLKPVIDSKSLSLEEMADSNSKVSTLASQMDKNDLALAADIAPINKDYSSSYKDIAKAKKEYKEITDLPSDESKRMEYAREVVEEKYASKLNELDKKFYAILSQIDEQLIPVIYSGIAEKSEKAYKEALKGNEAEFLAESIKGQKFLDFYVQFYQAKAEQEAAKQQQQQAGGRQGQQRSRPNPKISKGKKTSKKKAA